jgi:hypothetical protein
MASVASSPSPAWARPQRTAVRDWRFIAAVIGGGVLIRLIWLVRVHGRLIDFLGAAEASHVALSVATGRGIADAYFPGQGPTAHLLPLNPLISGFFMWLWGPGTVAADLTLLIWALAQVIIGYLLVAALFRQLGMDRATVRWSLALVMLVTPFVPQEVIDFRYWEGASALCLVALNLLMIARLDATPVVTPRTIGVIAMLSAITFFVSPPAGLAVDICWAVAALRRLPLRRCVTIALASAAALAAIVAPWALRNQAALGAPVPLRSDIGLELALANYPGALDTRDPARAFADRIAAIDPAGNPALRPLIAEHGGEVAYAHALGARTWRWMTAHPVTVGRLWLRHLRGFLFPEPWQFYFSGWEGMRAARAATISLVALLGLIGLAAGLIERRRGFWLPLLYVAMLAFTYALFVPSPRYIFLIYPILAFPAVGVLRRLASLAGAGWAR